MRSLYVALVFAGCASAGKDMPGAGGRPDSGINTTPKDGSVMTLADAAPLPDAPPGQTNVTLSQTTNTTLAPTKGIACGNAFGTSDNSWYRVFKLSDYGINGAFNLQRVTFMTDYAYAGTGITQAATLKIGTYAGTLEATTLTLAQVTSITTKAVTIPDGDAAVAVPAPVVTDVTATIPAGAALIVELSLPNGTVAGNYFYIGVSAGGEAKKGYIRATPSSCNFTTPTSLRDPAPGVAAADNAILLSVTGTH